MSLATLLRPYRCRSPVSKLASGSAAGEVTSQQKRTIELKVRRRLYLGRVEPRSARHSHAGKIQAALGHPSNWSASWARPWRAAIRAWICPLHSSLSAAAPRRAGQTIWFLLSGFIVLRTASPLCAKTCDKLRSRTFIS